MKKVIIIVASAILVVGIAVAAVFLMMPKGKELGFGAETVPCGLAWGMTTEEVCAALDAAGYSKFQVSAVGTTRIYKVTDYQGISGANGKIMLFFSEAGELQSATYQFCCDMDAKGPLVTQAMLDDLEFSFHKVYANNCSAEYKPPQSILPGKCYMCDHSFVNVFRDPDDTVWVDFMDPDSSLAQGLLSEVGAYQK